MENEFNISNGNLIVLQTIPEMMLDDKWRKKIRLLVMDYKFGGLKSNKKDKEEILLPSATFKDI